MNAARGLYGSWEHVELLPKYIIKMRTYVRHMGSVQRGYRSIQRVFCSTQIHKDIQTYANIKESQEKRHQEAKCCSLKKTNYAKPSTTSKTDVLKGQTWGRGTFLWTLWEIIACFKPHRVFWFCFLNCSNFLKWIILFRKVSLWGKWVLC